MTPLVPESDSTQAFLAHPLIVSLLQLWVSFDQSDTKGNQLTLEFDLQRNGYSLRSPLGIQYFARDRWQAELEVRQDGVNTFVTVIRNVPLKFQEGSERPDTEIMSVNRIT